MDTRFKKGAMPWNKDKHPEYMQGANNPMWKKGKTLVRCLYCKKDFGVYGKRVITAHFCSRTCAGKYRFSGGHHPMYGKRRLDIIGENNPLWNGGSSRVYKDGYNSYEYRMWRRQIFERDNYVCQSCGFKGNKGYITAHHIKSFTKYPELRFEIGNGLTLCEPCHSKTDNYKGKNKGGIQL